jgi:hypothetical protein
MDAVKTCTALYPATNLRMKHALTLKVKYHFTSDVTITEKFTNAD